jgi:hypothetical protein
MVGDAELELLLPWHAAGLLSEDDATRITGALAASPDLASRFARVQHERAETIGLNENLGAPSTRVMTTLMAAIDAESALKRGARRFAGFAARRSRDWPA